jgi:hypothetical protein
VSTGDGANGAQHGGPERGHAFDWLGGERGQVSPVTPAGATEQEQSPTPFVDTRRPRKRARTSPLGWAALVFAVLAPPLGLILSLIARSLSLKKYRRTTKPVNAAFTLSIVFCFLLAASGAVGYAIAQANADEAKIVADSKPFCDSLGTTPGVLDEPAFGWPVEVKSLPDTEVDMKSYQKRWQDLAKLAPTAIRVEVRSIAAAAKTVVDSVESTDVINRQSNLDKMSSVTDATTIPAYVAKYCKSDQLAPE